MAYATALSIDSKVKFFIELPNYKHVVSVVKAEKPVADIAPVVVKAEEPVADIAPVVVKAEEPVADIAPVVVAEEVVPIEAPKIEADIKIEADLDFEGHEHHHHHHGKKGKGKGKKGKKGKCGGGADMPRNAIKNLIR